MRLFYITIFLLLIFAFDFNAQTPRPTPPDEGETIKISTNLIQVDVTVTDKAGNVVRDLRPEEFEIYENGKKQTVSNFSFISVDQPTEIATRPAVPQNAGVPIPLPPARLKAEQVRRTYALVVDDLGLSFGSVFWVRQSLRKFVNEQMREGDLVAIIRTGSGIGALQSFTSDKRQLIAAIDKIKWNAYGRSGIGIFNPIGTTLKEDLAGTRRADGSVQNPQGDAADKEFENQIEEYRRDNFSVGTLGAMSYIIRGMQNIPGRKAIILLSEGFAVTSSGRPNEVLSSMRLLADLANRSSVVFYPIDPRGLQDPSMANADDAIREVVPNNPGMDRFNADPRDARAALFRESQMSLRYLAEETGGFAVINQNSLDRGLLRAVNDHGSYYLLGYQPDEETFDPKRRKFNKLEVRTTRPGLKVRYRSGFFGITDELVRNAAQNERGSQKTMTALTSPFSAGEVNLSLYPVFQNNVNGGDSIEALVYINANDLNFAQTADGKHRANFELFAMTFGDNGVPVDQLLKNYTLEIGEKVYQNMLKNGFVYKLSVPIKKPGAYQLRVALRDIATEKVGSASQFVEVPNIKKRTVLSSVLLDNFTPDEWQRIKLGASRDESEKSALLDAALRQFRSSTILRYDYVIYNPKQSRRLKTQLRLIKDGRIVYEEAPEPVAMDGQADLTRVAAAGALTLGQNLEAGSYVLQVIVTDEANAKNLAAQFVEFEIAQ